MLKIDDIQKFDLIDAWIESQKEKSITPKQTQLLMALVNFGNFPSADILFQKISNKNYLSADQIVKYASDICCEENIILTSKRKIVGEFSELSPIHEDFIQTTKLVAWIGIFLLEFLALQPIKFD